MWRIVLLMPLAACGSAGGTGGFAGPTLSGLSCAPFARALTGVSLHGDAASWWVQSDGRYAHVQTPQEGSILVFRAGDRLPYGHVSVVSRVTGSRSIEVIQANWVARTLEEDRPVVDVSERGDWTLVRVWWSPVNAMGSHAYPTYGFIVPARPLGHDALAAGADRAAERAAAHATTGAGG